jgi:hypothetical protein
MTANIPSDDGEVNCYDLGGAGRSPVRVYFVNGIRVSGRDHAVTAGLLSLLIESPVWGVYNRTTGAISGLIFDVAQCMLDYTQNVTARFTSHRNLHRPPVPDVEVPELLRKVKQNSVVWNCATARLVEELVLHRHTPQMIVAHSQGNLITSNALFVLEDLLGASALHNIRVYSLASPAPAWPLGLRYTNGGGGRQDNGFMNDLVALLRPQNLAAKVGVSRFQNAGDFRTHSNSSTVSLSPHDVQLNMSLNFLKSMRADLGLNPGLGPHFLEQCAALAESQFSTERSFWQWLDDMF